MTKENIINKLRNSVDKSVQQALIHIPALSNTRVSAILFTLGLSPKQKYSCLNQKIRGTLIGKVCEIILFKKGPRRLERENIGALVDLACYRGRRHAQELPVRGQRTRSNAKTQKKLGFKRI